VPYDGKVLGTRLLHLFEDDPSAAKRLAEAPDLEAAIVTLFPLPRGGTKFGLRHIIAVDLLQIIDGVVVVHHDRNSDTGAPWVPLTVSSSTRAKVILRDDLVCQICGGQVGDGELELDHIVPVCFGGSNRIDNLRVAHRDCNRRRKRVAPKPRSTRRRRREVQP